MGTPTTNSPPIPKQDKNKRIRVFSFLLLVGSMTMAVPPIRQAVAPARGSFNAKALADDTHPGGRNGVIVAKRGGLDAVGQHLTAAHAVQSKVGLFLGCLGIGDSGHFGHGAAFALLQIGEKNLANGHVLRRFQAAVHGVHQMVSSQMKRLAAGAIRLNDHTNGTRVNDMGHVALFSFALEQVLHGVALSLVLNHSGFVKADVSSTGRGTGTTTLSTTAITRGASGSSRALGSVQVVQSDAVAILENVHALSQHGC